MPAAIGPLGPLLADPAQARSEPSSSGRGSAFAKILETEGQSDRASPEKDGERSDGAGSAAVLVFSSQAHAPTEDTTTETEVRSDEVDAKSDLVAVAPDRAPQVVAAPAGDTDVAPVSPASDELAAPELLSTEQVRPSGEVKVDATSKQEADIIDIASAADTDPDAKLEVARSKADPVSVDTGRPLAETEVLSVEKASDGPVRNVAAASDTTDVSLVAKASSQHADGSEADASNAGEIKTDKVVAADASTNANVLIRGNEAPGRPDLVMATLNPTAQTTDKGTGRLKDVPATPLPAEAAPASTIPADAPRLDRADTPSAITVAQPAADTPIENAAFMNGGLDVSAQATGTGDSGQQTPTLSLAASAPATAPMTAQAPAGGAAGMGPVMVATQATVVAAPQEIVDIVSNKLAGGDKPDRIMVQLDPPELGRVSIEFKFDAQGLQQVAVRADTPEAMKQLRLLHFDLVQSLEQHGLSARDMTFSEGSTDGSQYQQPADFIDYTAAADDDAEFLAAPAMPQTRRAPITLGASGLNIKL